MSQDLLCLLQRQWVLREKGYEQDHANYNGTDASHLEHEANTRLRDLGESIVFNTNFRMDLLHLPLLLDKPTAISLAKPPSCEWTGSYWEFEPVNLVVDRGTSGFDETRLFDLYTTESVVEPIP